ncbi:hypothetical protein JD844_000029 [Phrynosoma platyrhinos]|uniref:Cathepsin A n=1 Tax=Phrynosoma platyrhinos TaxID=52577 RepID=A0ABQ7SQ32_PHRPL|nr:hypothetical protein JD844_000029 [Phrynosoma platyrhinos]
MPPTGTTSNTIKGLAFSQEQQTRWAWCIYKPVSGSLGEKGIMMAARAMAIWLTFFLGAFLGPSAGQYSPDLITSLPGLPEMPAFQQWSGYLQAGPDHYFHYWFVESQGNPSTDPVVLWLNGGPGCSSMEGLLAENGPFHLNTDGTLYLNPNSWNQVANMLYIESPAGVGYSYSTTEDASIDDSQAIYAAPPTYFLFSCSLWASLNENCCSDGTCNFSDNENSNCITAISEANRVLYGIGLNMYNLYASCWGGAHYQDRYEADLSNLFRHYQFNVPVPNVGSIPGTPPCINATAMYVWLNADDVRQALHIPSSLPNWELCSSQVMSIYQREYKDMAPFYKYLLAQDVRALVYNGDVDMACNFLGGEKFVQSLNQSVLSGFQPWYYNDQVAGFFKEYEKITFLTVKGAGHMVPQYKPGQALKMFECFLSQTSYV